MNAKTNLSSTPSQQYIALWVLCVAFFAFVPASHGVTFQQLDTTTKQTLRQGRRSQKKGKYARALFYYQSALAKVAKILRRKLSTQDRKRWLFNRALTYRFIGETYQKNRQPHQAMRYFCRCLEESPTSADFQAKIHAPAKSRLKDMYKKHGAHLEFLTLPAAATIVVKPVVCGPIRAKTPFEARVAAGTLKVLIRHPGYQPIKRTYTTRPGQSLQRTFTLVPIKRPQATRRKAQARVSPPRQRPRQAPPGQPKARRIMTRAMNSTASRKPPPKASARSQARRLTPKHVARTIQPKPNPSPPPHRGRRIAGWALLGVVAASAIAGGVFVSLGQSLFYEYDSRIRDPGITKLSPQALTLLQDNDLKSRQSGQALQWCGVASFGVAGAASIAATILLVQGYRTPQPPQQTKRVP